MTTPYIFASADLVDIHRFCGYPPRRADNGTILFGIIFNAAGELEYLLQMLSAEEGAVAEQYLTDLRALEAALMTASTNLDTDQAGIWHHNKDELAERRDFFNAKRRDLCNFLGIQPGPQFGRGQARWAI